MLAYDNAKILVLKYPVFYCVQHVFKLYVFTEVTRGKCCPDAVLFLHRALLEAYTARAAVISADRFDVIFPQPITADSANEHIDREFKVHTLRRNARHQSQTVAAIKTPKNMSPPELVSEQQWDTNLNQLKISTLSLSPETNELKRCLSLETNELKDKRWQNQSSLF